MKTKVKKWLVKHGNAICAVAVSLASLSSLCCRGCCVPLHFSIRPLSIIPLLPGMLVSTRGTGRVEGVCKKSYGVEMGGRSL